MQNITRFFSLIFITLLFSCGQPPADNVSETPPTDAVETTTQSSESASGVLLQKWEEGVHYTVFSDQATEQRQVQEYFSFWCPACYGFEPIVEMVKGSLDEDVKFEKVHVYFMGFTTPEIQNDATRAMAIGHYVGQGDKYTALIFDHIHKQRKSITGLNDLRDLFIANGLSGEEFDGAAHSEEVAAMVKQNNDAVDKYRAQVPSVPTFLINGKYKPIFNRNMTIDDMIELINWLSSQK